MAVRSSPVDTEGSIRDQVRRGRESIVPELGDRIQILRFQEVDQGGRGSEVTVD